MPEDTTQMTGTPAQDDGDGASAQTGTPVQEGGDAGGESPEQELARLRNERALYLASKDKVERANKIEAEMRRMQEEQARSYQPPPTNDLAQQQAQQEWQRLQDAMAKAQLAAANGDYVAEIALANLRQQAATQQQLMLEAQLSYVPEQARAAVRAELQTGRYADAQAAYYAVVGRLLSQREMAMQQQQRELDTVAQKRAAGVVGTGRPVPVTAQEMKRSAYTATEFAQEYDKLAREDPTKAREFAARFNRGEYTLSGG